MNLPIKASLTTRDGFHKCIDIPELKPVIHIARTKNMNGPVQMEPDNFYDCTQFYEKIDFKLEKWREVKQKKGLHHIVAVYKEI